MTAADAVTLAFEDPRLLVELCGAHDRHLALVESGLEVTLLPRGDAISIVGPERAREAARRALEDLYTRLKRGLDVTDAEVSAAVRMAAAGHGTEVVAPGRADPIAQIRTPKRLVTARTPAQTRYVDALQSHDMTFGVGPAGTGKTYLAVAMGVSMLVSGQVERMVLSRPAVEAGERIGFLPGDMRDKVEPFLRPLYAALYDMLPGHQVERKLGSGEIEIAPLAFMRGRTLSRAYIILDEAQNASPQQMKMFLTRLGEDSRMAITGDPSQADLPAGHPSGLGDALRILQGVEGVAFTHFQDKDVIRHALVQRIVAAYGAAAQKARSGDG